MAIDVELLAWRNELQAHRVKVRELETQLHALTKRVEQLEGTKKKHGE